MNGEEKQTDINLTSLTSLDLGPKWDEDKNKQKNTPKLKSNKTNKKKKIWNKNENLKKEIFKIDINYNSEVLNEIKSKIRKNCISYSLEEITNVIVSSRERLRFKIEKNNNLKFYRSKFDNKIFDSIKDSIDHINCKEILNLIDIEKVSEENPKGNFQYILKCPKTEKLFPPKNYHLFEESVNYYMFKNKLIGDLNNFVTSLIEEKNEEVIQKWKETPIEKRCYRFKNKNFSEKIFSEINSIILFTKKNYQLFIDELSIINFLGSEFKLIPIKTQLAISNFMDREYKWKKELFFSILINFKKSGFSIFKHGLKKRIYISPAKTKHNVISTLSENCKLIIDYIKKNSNTNRKRLFIELNKNGIDKKLILHDLKWLIQEGFIREFSNGLLLINH